MMLSTMTGKSGPFKRISERNTRYRKSMLLSATLLAGIILFSLLSGCKGEDEGSHEADRSKSQKLTVSFVIGNVTIVRNGTSSKARVGMKLGETETVRTEDKQARCTLKSPSGTSVVIAGNSKLLLARLYKDDKLNIEKTDLELVVGKVLVKARKMVGKDDLNIKTSTATAGVRGTQFVVSHYPDRGTEVAVRTGKVAVQRNIRLKTANSYLDETLNRTAREKTEVIVRPNRKINIDEQENKKLEQELQKRVDNNPLAKKDLDNEELEQASREILDTAGKNIRNLKPEKAVTPISGQDDTIQKDFKTLEKIEETERGTSQKTNSEDNSARDEQADQTVPVEKTGQQAPADKGQQEKQTPALPEDIKNDERMEGLN